MTILSGKVITLDLIEICGVRFVEEILWDDTEEKFPKRRQRTEIMPSGCAFAVLLLSLVLCDVCAFNVETRLPIVKSDGVNSWFGATVVFHSTTATPDVLTSR